MRSRLPLYFLCLLCIVPACRSDDDHARETAETLLILQIPVTGHALRVDGVCQGVTATVGTPGLPWNGPCPAVANHGVCIRRLCTGTYRCPGGGTRLPTILVYNAGNSTCSDAESCAADCTECAYYIFASEGNCGTYQAVYP